MRKTIISSVSKTVPADGFSVDGAKIVVVEVGHSDGDNTTVLHVPSIGLVVAGVVIDLKREQLLPSNMSTCPQS